MHNEILSASIANLANENSLNFPLSHRIEWNPIELIISARMIFSICSNWNYREQIISPTHSFSAIFRMNSLLNYKSGGEGIKQRRKRVDQHKKTFSLTFLQSCSSITSAPSRWSALAIQLRVLFEKILSHQTITKTTTGLTMTMILPSSSCLLSKGFCRCEKLI